MFMPFQNLISADVSQRDNSPHYKAADYAGRLRKCLLSVKSELTKLSPNEVRPNLDRLVTTLENALMLATDLVRKCMKPELSAMLRGGLQRMCTIATQLHIHNTKRDRSAYHPLNKVRRLLTVGRRLASLLHVEVETLTTEKTTLGLDSDDETDEEEEIDEDVDDSSKSSTSLTLAVQSGSTPTQTGFSSSQSTTPQLSPTHSSPQSSTNHLSTAGTSSSCQSSPHGTNLQDNETEMDINKSTSAHWTPSLKCKFFLKHPTLVFKGLTVEHVLNLGKALSAERQSTTKSTDKQDKKVQDNPLIYENTCRDLQSALESITDETNQQSSMDTHSSSHQSCSTSDTQSSSVHCPDTSNGSQTTDQSTDSVSMPPAQETLPSMTSGLSTVQSSTAQVSSSCESSGSNHLTTQAEMDTNTTSTTSSESHWKPSLNSKFFLKPAKIIFKGMTVELALNLGRALAIDKQSAANSTNKEEDKKVKPSPLNYETISRDLNDALPLVATQSNQVATHFSSDQSPTAITSSNTQSTSSHSTNTVCQPIDQSTSTGSTSPAPLTKAEANKTTSTINVSSHWKPSLKVPFFLKPPTFIFKGLTTENMQSLASVLAAEKQATTDNDSTTKTHSNHPGVSDYVTTCRDLHNALPSTSAETSQLLEEMAPLPNIREEKKQALTQLATKLKQFVTRVQHEVKKLSPKDVHPNVDHFKTALNNTLSFITTILRNHLKTEFTETLKEDLQNLSSNAKKLSVPNSKQDHSSARGLRRARHMLDTAVHMATLLHTKVEELIPTKEVASAFSEQAQSSTSVLTETKEPDGKTRMVVKIAFQDFIAKSSQGKSKGTKTSTPPPTDDSDDAQGSDHWRPSMNKPFFLKKPTLVYKELTEENLQNLANILSSQEQRRCQEMDKTSSQNQACEDMENKASQIQSPTHKETEQGKEQDCSKEHGVTRKRKLSMLCSRNSILDDVIDVGLVKRRHVSTKEKSSLSTSQTLKSTKKSCIFKPPKSRPSRLLHMKCSPSKRANEIVAEMTAMELAKLDIGCKPPSKLKDVKPALSKSTCTSPTPTVPAGVPYNKVAGTLSNKCAHQLARHTEEKPKGSCSGKASKTSRVILTATRRLSPSASPQEAYNKPDFIIETGLLIGAEVCVLPAEVEDHDQDTEPEDVWVTLGKVTRYFND